MASEENSGDVFLKGLELKKGDFIFPFVKIIYQGFFPVVFVDHLPHCKKVDLLFSALVNTQDVENMPSYYVSE